MDYYLYILKCNDGSYYTGQTSDLNLRLSVHEQGLINCYTYMRRPIELVFHEAFPNRNSAFEAERQIKKWTRKKKEALINGDWKLLQKLSKKNFNK
jgi:predicted GIY-YIG superfamily endonuclease